MRLNKTAKKGTKKLHANDNSVKLHYHKLNRSSISLPAKRLDIIRTPPTRTIKKIKEIFLTQLDKTTSLMRIPDPRGKSAGAETFLTLFVMPVDRRGIPSIIKDV